MTRAIFFMSLPFEGESAGRQSGAKKPEKGPFGGRKMLKSIFFSLKLKNSLKNLCRFKKLL